MIWRFFFQLLLRNSAEELSSSNNWKDISRWATKVGFRWMTLGLMYDISQVVLTSYFCWRLIAVATLQIWRQIQINLASYNGNRIVYCDLTISKQMNFSLSLSSSEMSSNSANISLSFDANKCKSVSNKPGVSPAIFQRDRLVG